MKSQSSQLLESQLDFLESNAAPERWQHEHEVALRCRDIEDLIALALETLERIRKHSDRAATGSTEDSASALAHWQRWHSIAVRALESVQWIENQGHRLDQADTFRFAVNEASMAANWEKIAAARVRLDKGQGRSLEEIENELSHKAG